MRSIMRILCLAVVLVFLVGTASALTYTNVTPYAYTITYVNTTSVYNDAPANSYMGYHATNLSKSTTGAFENASWIGSNGGSNTNQRFHVDTGAAGAIVRRIYYENLHNNGDGTKETSGINNFTFWGSNSSSSFSTMTYATDTGWTSLTVNISTFIKHPASNTVDPHYISVSNTVPYRYYAYKISNNWGAASYMGTRRLALQKEDEINTTVYVRDITTGALIITSSLEASDSVGSWMGTRTFNSTTGIFTNITTPSEEIILEASASGYTSYTYIFTPTTYSTVTLYLTPEPVVAKQNIWYSPKEVKLSVVDNYANPISGIKINATANATSFPPGNDWLVTMYGLDQDAANQMSNGTLIMGGYTGTDGAIAFTMHSSISYDIRVSSGGNENFYILYPKEPGYQLSFIVPGAARTDIQTCVLPNSSVRIGAPNVGNTSHLKLTWTYDDICNLTTLIEYYVVCDDTHTLEYYSSFAPTSHGPWLLNFNTTNTRGKNFRWWANVTRSV